MSDKKTIKGLTLRSVEGVASQAISFLIQMVLARILMPEDFGVVAILSTFTNFANTLVNNGLTSALIQRKHIEKVDVCTVFYIELGIGILMYVLIFFAAPGIAVFYENTNLTVYLRIYALMVLCSPFSSIQLNMGRRNMNFIPSLVSTVASIVVQAVVGIVMALNGFGAWSLVLSQVASCVVRMILLTVMTRWMPALAFSFNSFKSLFSYSWKLFVGWLVGTLYQDAFAWIIGKSYDSRTLGCYTKGQSIPAVVNRIASQVVGAVMFPAIARNQDDKALVKRQTKQMIVVSAALILPVMAGLAGAARSLVAVLLTEKWLDCVPVIQIMCIPLALNVISNANMQTFNAMGWSDLFLKMELIKRGATILVVLICVNINYYLMLASVALGSVVSIVINAVFNSKRLGYGYREYLWDIVPYLICSLGLFLGVKALDMVQINLYVRFALQLGICVAVYLGLVFSGILPGFKAIRSTVLSLRKRK